MLNYHWHVSIHRSKQESNTHVLLLLIQWVHTRGWSRFLWFIIAHHIQCMVFADSSGLTWVMWTYIAAYGKRTLIRIHNQPLYYIWKKSTSMSYDFTHTPFNPVPESSILLSLALLRWRWQWRNGFWDPFLSRKFKLLSYLGSKENAIFTW